MILWLYFVYTQIVPLLGTHDGGTKDKQNFLTTARKSTTVIPSSAAYRDPCDPTPSITTTTTTSTVPSLPPPPSRSQVVPLSMPYPSQQQSLMYGGVMVKSTAHVSSHTTTTSVTSNTGHGSRTRAVGSGHGSSKKAGANVKPLSTQERMSMFMEHTVASSNKSTPKIVIRKDANFKSACNKMRWLNKGREAARTMTSSAGNSKDLTTAGSSGEKVNEENGSQFYSFHEKADPLLDESVNPPVKLPSALLVRV